MYLISLRGNINGPDDTKENKPYQVGELLKEGWHCWVDVWWHDGSFWLGKDEPKHAVKASFLNIFGIWCNARNFETLLKLKDIKAPHCFLYDGIPTFSFTNEIITDRHFEGREASTILLTDDVIYTQMGLKGIVSANISDFR